MPSWQSNLRKILTKISWEFSLTPQLFSASEISSPASALSSLCHPLRIAYVGPLKISVFLPLPLPGTGNLPPEMLQPSSSTCYSPSGSIFSIELLLTKSNCLSNWVSTLDDLSITTSTYSYNPLLEHKKLRLKLNQWLGSSLDRSVWVSRWFSPYLN